MRPDSMQVIDWLLEDTSTAWHVDVALGHQVHAQTWATVAHAADGAAAGDSDALPRYCALHGLYHAQGGKDSSSGRWPGWDDFQRLCSSTSQIAAMVGSKETARLARQVARGAAAMESQGRELPDVVSDTRGWLRAFAGILSERNSPGLARLFLRFAHPNSWLSMAAKGSRGRSDESLGLMVHQGMLRNPECAVLTAHTRAVTGLLAIGSVLLSVDDLGHMIAWDAFSGEAVASVRAHQKGVTAVGRNVHLGDQVDCVVTGSEDGSVHVWDAHGWGGVSRGATKHDGPVKCVALSPSGDIVASGGTDGSVKVHDCASGEQIAVLKGHKQAVKTICFSSDGNTLVSGSEDNTVRS